MICLRVHAYWLPFCLSVVPYYASLQSWLSSFCRCERHICRWPLCEWWYAIMLIFIYGVTLVSSNQILTNTLPEEVIVPPRAPVCMYVTTRPLYVAYRCFATTGLQHRRALSPSIDFLPAIVRERSILWHEWSALKLSCHAANGRVANAILLTTHYNLIT